MPPWKYLPQLKEEHLVELAVLIAQVRAEVIERHEPELGDTRLSLGVRAYECCRTRIIEKATIGDWPWLSVVTEEGRFTFTINGVPIRFSRNDPEELPDRKLVRSEEAKQLTHQLSLFGDAKNRHSLHWFYIIDTPYDVAAENVFVVGYDEDGQIECFHDLELTDQVPAIGGIDENKPQSVEIPPAKVKLKKPKSHNNKKMKPNKKDGNE